MNARYRCLVLVLPALALACGGDSGPRLMGSERIIVVPVSATITVGGTQQFSASRKLSDGTMEPNPSVSWSATGGTITTAGLYTAGTTPGSFRVIAALSGGGTLADTSDVTITPAGGHSYSTSFPLTENPISDGGRWLNGGTTGLDWTNVSTTPGLAIGHQCCASYTDATALLTGTWGPDQQVSATVHTVNQNDACFQEAELRLRSAIAPHSNTGYEISFKMSQTAQAYLIIVRWNGALGDFTYLLDTRGAQFGIKDGDVISAKVVGNVITAYRNGVQLGQATDNTYAGGSPGMGFNLENAPAGCSGTNGNYGYTSLTATDAP